DSRLIPTFSIALLLAVLTWTRRLTIEEAGTGLMAGMLGLSGLCPQYLVWLVPFLILSGKLRLTAVYTLLAGAFLVLYYQVPFVNRPNAENLGAYSLLKPLGHFGPSLGGSGSESLVRLLGNYAIPLFCIACLVSV